MSDHSQTGREHLHHLQDIIAVAQDSQRELANITYEQFRQDFTLIRSTMTVLNICGEAVKKLPEELVAKHHNVKLGKLAGLRDIIVHQYGTIDIQLLWRHATNGLPRVLEELCKHYPQCIPTKITPTGGG